MSRKYQFGPFQLDADERIFCRNGDAIHLQPKDFDVLVYLLKHQNQLAGKQDIIDAVWDDVVVTENSLNRCVGKIRDALGDNKKQPEYIETIPTLGYRFICDVQLVEKSATGFTNVINESSAELKVNEKTKRNTVSGLVYLAIGLVMGAIGASQFIFTDSPTTSQPLGSSNTSLESSLVKFTLPISGVGNNFLGGVMSTQLGRPWANSLVFSSDGSFLVYTAWQQATNGQLSSQLYLRKLDQIEAEPIAGTEGAEISVISPDDQWIGFLAEGSLKRVPVSGGSVEILVTDARTGNGVGLAWGDDGTIVYGGRSGLYQVSESGGNGELIADAVSSGTHLFAYNQPHFLPGSEVILFHAMSITMDPERAEILALNLSTGTMTSVLSNAMNPIYVEDSGHLMFMRQGSLLAVSFDPEQLSVEGDPVLLLDDVMHQVAGPMSNLETGVAQLAFSHSGHLAYIPGGIFPIRRFVPLRLSSRGEAELIESISLTNIKFMGVKLSPDNSRIAFSSGQGQKSSNIFVHDFTRNVTEQLNTGGFSSWWPKWSPDGTSIAFNSNREDDNFYIYSMPIDGSEEPTRLVPSDRGQVMQSWSADGAIAYLQAGESSMELWVLPPDGTPAVFATADRGVAYATFSPDGKWLAYVPAGPLGMELYIQPYPGPGPAILVHGHTSQNPAWSQDGSKLYFTHIATSLPEATLMVVDAIEGNPSLPRTVFDPWPYIFSSPNSSYDVLEDGGFITSMLEEQFNSGSNVMPDTRDLYRVNELQVILNFQELLRERVPN